MGYPAPPPVGITDSSDDFVAGRKTRFDPVSEEYTSIDDLNFHVTPAKSVFPFRGSKFELTKKLTIYSSKTR
jgi:hypothetical protein